jgi:type II secretory pathway component GspD/PulD (secretin)
MKKVWVFLLLSLFCSYASAQTEFKIITLQHRFAQDLLPAVQPMVGEGGTASAVNNQLLVRATPERMVAIEQAVAALDVSRKNVRITISHDDVQQSRLDRLGISGRLRSGDVRIGAGEVQPGMRDGLQLEVDRGQTSMSQRGSEFVTVLDGERAFIRVGQSVPYTQQWALFTQRYLSIQQATEFRDITTGFAVRPRYIGDQLELEIAPRIARLNNSGFIDFEELATTVRVTPGQWFDLGGTMQSKDEVSRAILRNQQGDEVQTTSLMIKVD